MLKKVSGNFFPKDQQSAKAGEKKCEYAYDPRILIHEENLREFKSIFSLSKNPS